MYGDSSNPMLDEANYIQTRVPDITELGNILRKAKGKNRTMAEYAKECGASPSTFSRIANGKITQPLSFETLANIWKYSDPEANIIFTTLTYANGLMEKSFIEKKEKRYPGNVQRDELQYSTEREIKNIIMEELLNRELAIVSQRRIHVDESVPAILASAGRSGLILQVQGYTPKYWNIKVMSYIGVRRGAYSDEPVAETDFECEADIMFHNAAEIFLKDAWEPEKTEKVKVSFAFLDIETLEAFYKNIKCAKVNGWFSLLLVDRECKKITMEKIIPRKDGRTMESLFSLPIVEGEMDWKDDYYWEI